MYGTEDIVLGFQKGEESQPTDGLEEEIVVKENS
jgi:hypothetical protein